jgi:hypothetical protein
VIEDIKRLDPNLQHFCFRQFRGLANLHVEIVDSRTVENAVPGIAELTERFRNESGRVEHRLPVARIRIKVERAGKDLWCIEQVVVNAVAQRAEQ